MPYAEDFDAAASMLDEQAHTVDALARPMRAGLGPSVLRGGVLTSDTASSIDEVQHGGGGDADELRSVAEECRRRAEVCRAAAAAHRAYVQASFRHDRAMGDWRADSRRHDADPDGTSPPGQPPRPPTRPPPPPPWVQF